MTAQSALLARGSAFNACVLNLRASTRCFAWFRMLWLALTCLLVAAPAAMAQTAVSGAIAVNARWTTSGNPYLVTSDVVVQNGAVLTVDPGVVVYMAAGASLTVQAGAIRALGTAATPIRVLSDKTRSGQVAAPGDWKQWTFNPGTVNTQLDNVLFDHGSGLIVNGSAPAFNYVSVRNQQGPAISTDLAASLSGVGNQASGNTLNGVLVPAGDVVGNVRWGLRGIPYVLSTGTVSVGASPTVTAVTPNTLQQGESATLTLTGTRLAGLASARFEKAGLTAEVLSGSTDTQAKLTVTADGTAIPGSSAMTLLLDAGEMRLANALTVAQSQPALTGLAPTTLYVGQGTVDVTLSGRNFTAQSVVLVNGAAVATQFISASQLKASIVASAAAGSLLVRLRTPNPDSGGAELLSNELPLQVAPAQLVLSPSSLTAVKGGSKTMNLSLPYAAATGGTAVTLVSSVPTVASVPATVTIPAGQTTAAFQVGASELGSTTITASRSGLISGQAQVTVITPPSLTLAPSVLTLGVGRTVDLAVQSSTPAPAGGLEVALASSNAAAATVPASVTIAAGSSTATTQVTTVAVGSASITAQATDYVNGQATVTVRPTSLNLPAGALVAPGLTRSVPLTLSDPAPAGGLVVQLVSSAPATVSVPASLNVPEGQTNINFTLTGVAAGTATVTASASGYQAASLPVTVEAVTISVGSPAVTGISLPAEITKNYTVNLSRPAPVGGVVVALNTADASKATVSPSTVTIAEGQTSGGLVTIGVTGVAKGATTLSAGAPGLTAASVPVTVTDKPALAFNVAAVTVGKALKTYYYEARILRRTDGNAYAPAEAVTVNLTSSNASKASVPATVTIPSGSSEAYFYITGVDLTGGTPVTIDATATGYTAPATKLATTVATPVFNIQSLDANRSPSSARDDFTVYVTTPGANYSGSQTAAADLPISLSIVEGTPAGIVDGFYSASTGGTAVTQLVLRKDNTTSETAYVGTPTAAGSYKVQASAAGVASGTSGVTTVSAPQLQFNISSVIVGKGLKTYYYEARVRRAVNGTVFNGAEAVTVNLTSSDASKVSVPAAVTIPAGGSEVYFYITGVDLTGGTPVTIDATATGYTAPATKLATAVVAPVFNIQSLDVNRSPSSARDDFTVYVTTPGSNYSGSQTAAADLPISLSIVEGAPAGIVDGFYSASTAGTAVTQLILRKDNTTSETAYVGTPTAAGSYKVQASAAGVATNTSGVVTVSAPQLQFSVGSAVVGKGLKTYYYEVRVRRAVNGTVFNGTEAVTVNLTSSDASKASVPATVTIPAGSSEAYFYITGVDLTGGTPVTIDATATGYTAPATKLATAVVAPVFNIQSLDANRSPSSARDDFTVYVTTPGAAYSGNQTAAADLPISLSIVEGTPAGIVDGFYSALTGGTTVNQFILRKDNTTSETAYVGTPTAAGSYKVQVSAAGVATNTSGVVTVSAPQLQFSVGSAVVGKGLKTYYYEVRVRRTVNGTVFNGVEAVTVNLSCSSTAICTVPATVTIPAGGSEVYFYITGVGVGNTTVVANAVGYSATQDLAVSVVQPQLNFSGPGNVRVGAQYGFSLYLTSPGAAYSGSQATAVPFTANLTSSAPGVATVPSTVSFAIGNTSSATVNMTGVGPGTTTLTASGAEMSSATSGVITVSP